MRTLGDDAAGAQVPVTGILPAELEERGPATNAPKAIASPHSHRCGGCNLSGVPTFARNLSHGDWWLRSRLAPAHSR